VRDSPVLEERKIRDQSEEQSNLKRKRRKSRRISSESLGGKRRKSLLCIRKNTRQSGIDGAREGEKVEGGSCHSGRSREVGRGGEKKSLNDFEVAAVAFPS